MMKSVALAIYSRIIVLLLAIIFGNFGSAYDISSDSPFIAWDAVYFRKLAATGSWDYEHEFAFFPGYPLFVRGLAAVLHVLNLNLTWDTIILLSGLTISNVSFIMASGMLYKLSIQLKMSEKFSRLTRLAFILNPSAIFMSSL